MDLFSLLEFIRCSPFDDLAVFNNHVVKSWRSRSDPRSVAKLKTLVNCFSLRRPKNTVTLPPRRNDTIDLDFSEKEWDHYQRVKTNTLHRIESATRDTNSVVFLNALQWVNELRLICNHGMMSQESISILEAAPIQRLGWSEGEAQGRFET